MKKLTARTLLTLILGLLLLFMFSGCSSDANLATAPAMQEPERLQGEETPYPVWTDEQIENLIPGFKVLRVDERAYGQDDVIDDYTQRFIRRTQGGTVSHRNNGVQIGAWQLWEDRTVRVETPSPGYAIADFYPHPYRFNGHIRIWLDLTYIQLPPGMRWDQVEMYYVNDNGNLERYWGYVDLNTMQYVAWTDHFSRYIIGIAAR